MTVKVIYDNGGEQTYNDVTNFWVIDKTTIEQVAQTQDKTADVEKVRDYLDDSDDVIYQQIDEHILEAINEN